MKIKQQIIILGLSIAISLFFWLQTVLLNEHETIISVPLVVNNIPEKSIKAKDIPTHMDFQIRGLGYEIIKFKLNKVFAQIDYQHLIDNSVGLSNSDYKINIPPGVNIEVIGAVSPTNESNYKSYINAYSLPVQIVFANEETRNLFFRKNYNLSANSISVKSHNEIPEYIKSIRTEVLKSEMLRNDKIRLKLINPSDNLILATQYVELIRSNSQFVTKVLSNVPIKSDQSIAFFPKEVTIRIRGLSHNIEDLNFEFIKVTIHPERAINNEIPVSVQLPAGIDLIDYSPKIVLKSDI